MYLTEQPTTGCHGLSSYHSFSPDGDRVLEYSKQGASGMFSIYDLQNASSRLIDINSHIGCQDAFTCSIWISYLSWSHDGQSIFGTTNTIGSSKSSIFIVDLDQESVAQRIELDFVPYIFGPSRWSQEQLGWAPDGSLLALLSGSVLDSSFEGKQQDHFAEYNSVLDSVLVIDIQGAQYRRFSFSDGFNAMGNPAFSQDGRFITVFGCRNCPTSVPEIHGTTSTADLLIRTVDTETGRHEDIHVDLPTSEEDGKIYIHAPSTRWLTFT